MLRIAIQTKGRLHDDSMDILHEMGIKLDYGRRQLLQASRNFPIEVLFLRDDDIPLSVAEGIADIGIVGENEYIEKAADAKIIKRLGKGKCRLSLAVPRSEVYTDKTWFDGKVIATSYPHILKKYLSENNIQANIHLISGSVEISPGIGISDAIFDIVSSGSTLVTNRLKEVEVVLHSEAVLIGNNKLSAEKQAILDDFLFRMEAVLHAEDKKYVLMNVPTENLQEIVNVIPGIKSPTIMPLANEGWSSLHAVINEKNFWEIIGQLKSLGAEGILVLPIEKMIP